MFQPGYLAREWDPEGHRALGIRSQDRYALYRLATSDQLATFQMAFK